MQQGYITNSKEITSIAILLPRFRQCFNYAERLAFWDQHWMELRRQNCHEGCAEKDCNCEVQLCYSAVDFDDGQDAGKARIAFGMELWITCKKWEDVKQWPILTLAPFNEQDARQFTDWALRNRPGMNGAPHSFKELREDFDKKHLAIPSDIDRNEHLEAERIKAYSWKNDQLQVGHAQRKNIGLMLDLDMDLFTVFAQCNRTAQPIDLAKYIPLRKANINWEIIDTYLFAQSKYQFALYLEHFESIPASRLFYGQPQAGEAEITPTRPIHELTETVERILAPLSGLNHRKVSFMNGRDFTRLINYSKYLAIYNKVPQIDGPIEKVDTSIDHIRYTYYRLHKELFGTRVIRSTFIDFMHSIFSQFSTYSPETTRSKFSIRPKSYNSDFGLE